MRNFKVRNLFIFFLSLSVLVAACGKDSFTPVDMNDLNPDEPLSNSELDQWLKTTFLDVYNMSVIYRYHRYYHEADRNVSPPKLEAVKPMMTTVLDGFITPYQNVAGETFMKVNVPKEWVLYGSTSYDGSNVGYAGTASGGARINLFGLNNFSLSPTFVGSRLGTIHHEFVHILNQRFIMPADFAEITKSTYNGDWTSTKTDSAHKWGYVSAYASQNPTEDYAETASSLLVDGQGWFDNWVKTSGSTAGQEALRAKEQNVVDYYNSSLSIDFRELQKEIQAYVKNVLKKVEVTFPYWLNQGLYKTITISPDEEMYSNYPLAPEFREAYDEFGEAIWNLNSGARYRLDHVQFRFESNTSLVVRTPFTATEGSAAGTQYDADYSFNVAINPSTSEITFTKKSQASGTTFDNGNLVLGAFENTIQAFLESQVFVGDYLPLEAPSTLYTKTAGFALKDNPNYFIYGLLGQQL